MRVEFTVPGEPVGKARPRFNRYSGRTYTPTKTANYESYVKLEYHQKYGSTMFEDKAMLRMSVRAYFGIPKSASKKLRQAMVETLHRPVKKPDSDNILKSVADALNQIAYHDDSQIVSAIIDKYYSDNPRVEITIEDIEGVQN